MRVWLSNLFYRFIVFFILSYFLFFVNTFKVVFLILRHEDINVILLSCIDKWLTLPIRLNGRQQIYSSRRKRKLHAYADDEQLYYSDSDPDFLELSVQLHSYKAFVLPNFHLVFFIVPQCVTS